MNNLQSRLNSNPNVYFLWFLLFNFLLCVLLYWAYPVASGFYMINIGPRDFFVSPAVASHLAILVLLVVQVWWLTFIRIRRRVAAGAIAIVIVLFSSFLSYSLYALRLTIELNIEVVRYFTVYLIAISLYYGVSPYPLKHAKENYKDKN